MQDNGPGIPARDLAQIFQPFHRGTGPDIVAEGSGLGQPRLILVVDDLPVNRTVLCEVLKKQAFDFDRSADAQHGWL